MLLLKKLVEIGSEERLVRIHGTILADNHAMRGLCHRAGFRVRRADGETEFEAEIKP